MYGGNVPYTQIRHIQMKIDYIKIKRSLLNLYRREHNLDEREFYRGLCWMEEVLTRKIEQEGFCETNEQQMIVYLDEQLKQVSDENEQLAREIQRLKTINRDLRKLSKKDRRELKKDINISVLCRDNRKLLKDRDLYLSRLNSPPNRGELKQVQQQ